MKSLEEKANKERSADTPMKKTPLILSIATFLTVGALTLFNVLDTFITEHASGTVDTEEYNFTFVSSTIDESEHTSVSYVKGTRSIDGKDVTYYLVEINLKSISDLRTQLATNSSGQYGSNITQSFSSIVKEAEEVSGKTVLAAISGDYAFWSGRAGYVIRNGVSYRSSQRTTSGEDFAIFKDGSILSYNESDVDFSSLEEINNGCYQNWCFGPTLLDNGNIAVEEDEEIDGRSKSDNQRTALGYAGNNHFYFLTTEVSGGRNSKSSSSFSLYNLAEFFKELGCTYAYNLDGGGSVSMYVNGDYPIEADRKLGDIIYVVDA